MGFIIHAVQSSSFFFLGFCKQKQKTSNTKWTLCFSFIYWQIVKEEMTSPSSPNSSSLHHQAVHVVPLHAQSLCFQSNNHLSFYFPDNVTGYRTLSQEVEEGICQVLAHMWLDSEIMSGSGSNVASSSSSSASTSSKKGSRSQFERKLGDFFKHQIESDTSSAYGDGFRAGNQAVLQYGLKPTLDHIWLTRSFPC